MKARGFSLIEMMLVVALIGIMALLAQGTLRETISRTRANGAVHAVAALLGRARVTAQKSHKRIRVNTSVANQLVLEGCPARYGAAGTCVSATTFSTEPQSTLRFGNQPESQGVTLTPPGTQLIFDAAGFPETVATYTFTLAHGPTGIVRRVVVTAAGEIRVE